jgi:hypothetical protein
MTTTQKYFNSWFRDVLRELRKQPETGFVVVISSIALLERYLRQKSGIGECKSVSDPFYDELRKLFPKISDNSMAKILWRVCRHGLMHQATFNVKSEQGATISEVGLDDSGEAIDCIQSGTAYNFKISPTKFSEKVIETIENDFSTFEGPCSSNHPLPDLHLPTSGSSNDGYSGYKPVPP